MPNCFTLSLKSEPSKPVLFAKIDEEICSHMGAEVHPTNWYIGWYDYIGFMLAVGKSFDEINGLIVECIEDSKTPEGHAHWSKMQQVNHFLAERYVSDAWYSASK